MDFRSSSAPRCRVRDRDDPSRYHSGYWQHFSGQHPTDQPEDSRVSVEISQGVSSTTVPLLPREVSGDSLRSQGVVHWDHCHATILPFSLSFLPGREAENSGWQIRRKQASLCLPAHRVIRADSHHRTGRRIPEGKPSRIFESTCPVQQSFSTTHEAGSPLWETQDAADV